MKPENNEETVELYPLRILGEWHEKYAENSLPDPINEKTFPCQMSKVTFNISSSIFFITNAYIMSFMQRHKLVDYTPT
jgi:hypothetical protein